jgi:hypothetical protein
VPTANSASLLQRFVSRSSILWGQLTLSEISGSFGDLGTFCPLIIALARQDAIRLGPSLFFAGLSNFITGYMWDVPMCVQPMKSIAAVAIAEGLTQTQVTAAGVWMGVLLVLLSVSNGIELVNLLVPHSVVSGIQMGVGFNLAIKGLILIQGLSWTHGLDCKLLVIICAVSCMYILREDPPPTTNVNSEERQPRRQQPTAPVGLILFGLGVILAIIHLLTSSDNRENSPLQLFGSPIFTWALKGATWHDWKQGLLEGAIPQLPLTTLNSVVSVCCLAHNLYPEKRRGARENSANDLVISRKDVSWSMGIMNLAFCPLGAMPSCHGAGGLAGQHKFGARHGSSVVFLGSVKMLLSILLGGSLLLLLDALPISILGLMLVISGHELAMNGLSALFQSTIATLRRNQSQTDVPNQPATADLDGIVLRKNAVTALITAIVDVGLHKTHYAALSGWVTHMVYCNSFQHLRVQVIDAYIRYSVLQSRGMLIWLSPLRRHLILYSGTDQVLAIQTLSICAYHQEKIFMTTQYQRFNL